MLQHDDAPRTARMQVAATAAHAAAAVRCVRSRSTRAPPQRVRAHTFAWSLRSRCTPLLDETSSHTVSSWRRSNVESAASVTPAGMSTWPDISCPGCGSKNSENFNLEHYAQVLSAASRRDAEGALDWASQAARHARPCCCACTGRCRALRISNAAGCHRQASGRRSCGERRRCGKARLCPKTREQRADVPRSHARDREPSAARRV